MHRLLFVLTLLFSGCVTTSGSYTVNAYDENGKRLDKNEYMAQGRAIYTMRNALCAAHPGATIIIKDIETGRELSSESPYHCSKG